MACYLAAPSEALRSGAATPSSKLAANSSPEWTMWDTIEARDFALLPERMPSRSSSWSVTVAAGHPGIDE